MAGLNESELMEVRSMLQKTRSLDLDPTWRNRMESKVDKMSEALVTLARLEERIITLFNQRDDDEDSIVSFKKELSDRLTKLEEISARRSGFFHWANELMVAMLGGFAYYMATVALSLHGVH